MKTVSIYLEVNDTDDAIRVLNDISQLPVGKLKGFNVYEEYKFNRGSHKTYITDCSRILEDEECKQ